MSGAADDTWARDWPLARMGYPEQPRRDGTHALRRASNRERVVLTWDAETRRWDGYITPEQIARTHDYIEPVAFTSPRVTVWTRLRAWWRRTRDE